MSKAENAILKFLNKNFRYSYQPKQLENYLKMNINTIRSELRRLHEAKKVIREKHGFYRIKMDPEAFYYLEKPPTLLHGIMVSMKWNRKLQNDIHGITADKRILDLFDRLKNNGFRQTDGKNKNRFVKSFHYENDSNRLVTVTIHFNGRLDVYINCSNHPVNYFEFRDILKYTQGTIDFIGPFQDQRVIQFGMAKDFKEIRLEGANSLTLRAFMNNWFRVYNKERLGVTRVEQHITTDVPVDTFVSMFERMFLPVSNGFSQREDERRDVV